ncbi:uncharacterized protein [Acropora muricata]|uniref:uncharacterized protein LOC114956718 n=1 Tax=Acropora millepora TaxID=45264 RepID=UPI0010FCCFFC|nr:uncharacterized protein LOC114956718 [Acropora millepora]XP_044184897.1 uncharacterized protein LOC122965021 [Acropora millepora]
MAAHKRKGQRPTEREMNLPWRNHSPRPNSPLASHVNGSKFSPHTVRKRESSVPQGSLEHKKNLEILTREWEKVEKERSRKLENVTDLVLRDSENADFQACDLDAFLENFHQLQQHQG